MMNRLTEISSIVLALILLLNAPRVIREYRLSKSDNLVIVTIQKLPDCSIGYKHKFIHIVYNGTTHILRTKCKYVAGLSKGQPLEMFHEPNTEMFLFKDDDVTFELISFSLLALILIICFVVRLKTK